MEIPNVCCTQGTETGPEVYESYYNVRGFKSDAGVLYPLLSAAAVASLQKE